MANAMGRRRQSNLNLPPRLHIKSGSYYYVTTDKPRKWIKLGKDKGEALRQWAEIEAGGAGDSSTSLATLIDDWMTTEGYLALSPNTRRQYGSVIRQIKDVFSDFPSVTDIKPRHIAQWQDGHKSKVMANTGKSIITTVLKLAIRRGIIERNPATEVENITVKRRTRYITDDEYRAIREHSTPVLRAAMDLSYVTGARIGDVLAIRLRDIGADGLTIRQGKTGKLQMFAWNSALVQAIDNAKAIKRAVGSLFLLCTLRGQAYKYAQINEWWVKARIAAGIDDVHFHDIRGKAATDGKRAGIDYQALLGHTTKAMSDSYIKLEDAQIVEPMARVL